MTSATKFQFGRTFDGQEKDGDLTWLKLKQETEKSYQLGFEDGMKEGLAKGPQDLENVCKNIEDEVRKICIHQENLESFLLVNTMKLFQITFQKMFPHFAKTQGINEIKNILESSLRRLIKEPVLTIKIAAAFEEGVKNHLADLIQSTGYFGKFVLTSSPSIEDFSVEMEWSDGGISHLTNGVRDELDVIFKEVLKDPHASFFDDEKQERSVSSDKEGEVQ